jgi:sugar phosphate permease
MDNFKFGVIQSVGSFFYTMGKFINGIAVDIVGGKLLVNIMLFFTSFFSICFAFGNGFLLFLLFASFNIYCFIFLFVFFKYIYNN